MLVACFFCREAIGTQRRQLRRPMRFSRLQFQNVCTLGTRKCVVRSRGAPALSQPATSPFRIRSKLVARALECAVAGSKTITRTISSSSTSRPANTRDLLELNNHRLGMFASVTFKRALIVVRLVGWLDTSKPHLTPAPWAWRQINRLGRIMNMRLLHSARSH